MSADQERLLDLLADRATVGLSAAERAELEQLIAASKLDPDSMDRAAAALDIAFSRGAQQAELPATLRASVLANWDARSSQPGNVIPLRRSYAWIGWVAAAAASLVAFFGWLPRIATTDLAKARQALIDQANDELVVNWKPTDDPSGKNVGGDIVWSNTLQKGFMRFHGLAKNDPRVKQYQLWIFDKAQDDRYPIDGGVFDIDSDTGDVIVPITAKIRVGEAKMFAITAEKPGGVVVSAREHLVALGQI